MSFVDSRFNTKILSSIGYKKLKRLKRQKTKLRGEEPEDDTDSCYLEYRVMPYRLGIGAFQIPFGIRKYKDGTDLGRLVNHKGVHTDLYSDSKNWFTIKDDKLVQVSKRFVLHEWERCK